MICANCGALIKYDATQLQFVHNDGDEMCDFPYNHPDFMRTIAVPKEN